jgi:hypothetical protein
MGSRKQPGHPMSKSFCRERGRDGRAPGSSKNECGIGRDSGNEGIPELP